MYILCIGQSVSLESRPGKVHFKEKVHEAIKKKLLHVISAFLRNETAAGDDGNVLP